MTSSFREVERQEREKPEDGAAEDTDGLLCGYGRWKPACLQRFNNSKALLAAVCFFTFVQGWVVTGINNINTSTLERRFELRSSEIAWIASANEISGGVLGIIMGYLSGFHHKGRMMSAGAAMMSVGSFIMFLPHLLAGNYKLNTEAMDECPTSGNYSDPTCGAGSSVSNYLYVFIAGQVLHGVGGVAVFNIGLTYLDDNIRSKDTPLFVGIMHCFAAIGPAVAFVAGGAMLNIHVDIGRVDLDAIRLRPSDPGWVGAWWIGYIISTMAAAIVALTLACFPKELPATRELKREEATQAYKGAGVGEMGRDNFGRSLSDAKLAVRVVVTNPTWLLVTIGATAEVAGVNAFASFLPKILQFQFNLTSGTAALCAGGLVITGAAGGHLLGGVIPRCFKSRLQDLLVQMLAYSIIGLCLSAVFLVRCDMPSIAGVNAHYGNTSQFLSKEEVVNGCNSHCYCTTRSYEPVCSHDNVLYFSPCHAGCSNRTTLSEGQEVYTQCSCIDGSSSSSSASTDEPWVARAGLCQQNCLAKLLLFLSVFLVAMLATFMTNTVGHAATMRCVPDKQKGFAYGIQTAIARFAGSVPAPLILGLVFDSSCLIWQEHCGQDGACWIYDSQSMGLKLTFVLVFVKTISSIAFLLARLLYIPPTQPDMDTVLMAGVSHDQAKQPAQESALSHDQAKQPAQESALNANVPLLEGLTDDINSDMSIGKC